MRAVKYFLEYTFCLIFKYFFYWKKKPGGVSITDKILRVCFVYLDSGGN